MMIKKLFVSGLCAVAVAMSVSSIGQAAEEGTEQPVIMKEELANPFIEYTSMKELRKVAGFITKSPHVLPENFHKTYIAMLRDKSFIEVQYVRSDEQKIVYKMAVKRWADRDISGDYTVYDWKQVVEVDNNEVTTRGNADGIHIAEWKDGEASYSLSFSQGISRKLIKEIIENIA
ncbi:MAG: DUF4367 domain-containing protein [Selenomonadaceae bacterium]